MQYSVRQTVIFAVLLCAVCSVAVSSVAVALHERQVQNRILDEQKNVLRVAGLMKFDESLPREEIQRRFKEGLVPQIIDLETGELASEIDPLTFNQQKIARDPATSRAAPDNAARVRRVPKYGRVFLIRRDGEVGGVIVPIEGMGLWSVLYGYLALADDTRTIEGITYYRHGETAGLGGEVDNPRWKALWPGRHAYDEQWQPKIRVLKGHAGSVEADPFSVDGLAGATLTSNGVTNMLHFWLGDDGFGPYLARYRAQRES